MPPADDRKIPGRNEPCPCGSGRRYKECCGQLRSGESRASIKPLMEAALAAQRSRDLRRAAGLYREVLAHSPDEPDALHMLGVVCYELGNDLEALGFIRRALELTGWGFWTYRHNLALVVSRLASARSRRHAADTLARYHAWRELREVPAKRASPKVAVVVPCHNHGRYVERALASVFAQTYRHVELVVIDDGSTDQSADALRRALKKSPFPSRFVSRPNRGAAATINEGVTQCDAEYVNVLNSDDAFTADRLQVMVDQVAAQGLGWGFAEVEVIGEDDREVNPLRVERALDTLVMQGCIPLKQTVGFALLESNVAISSGNLFFSRELFDRVGGFRDFRYNHDWDFSLRALRLAEPRYVRARTYRYRLHAANTIAENVDRVRSEADEVLRDYLQWATTAAPADSPWAPCVANWGEIFAITVLGVGMARALAPQQLRTMVENLLEEEFDGGPGSPIAPQAAGVENRPG